MPAYDELIYVAHQDNLADPRLQRFMLAVEDATHWLMNHPDQAWDIFTAYDAELDDELNRRAWADTLPRLALSPGGLDQGRYARFAAFLVEQGLIEKALPVSDYAIDLFAAN